MKNIIVLSVLISIISCKNNIKEDKETINGFIQNYYLKHDTIVNINVLSKYINYNTKAYNSLSETRKDTTNMMFNFFIRNFGIPIRDNGNQYEIYHSSEISKNLFDKLGRDIIYENKNKIYYVVSKDEIISLFILDDNHKIISFFEKDFMGGGLDFYPVILSTEEGFNTYFNPKK